MPACLPAACPSNPSWHASASSGLEEPLLSGSGGGTTHRNGTLLPPAAPREEEEDDEPELERGASATLRHHLSEMWQGGEEGEVQFIPAQTLVGAAPAVSPEEGRLGMAWMAEPPATHAVASSSARGEDKEDGPPGSGETASSEAARPPSRYSSAGARPPMLLSQGSVREFLNARPLTHTPVGSAPTCHRHHHSI